MTKSSGASASGNRRRGRKPKGGKVVLSQAPPAPVEVPEPNIVVHLRCRLVDLDRNVQLGSSTWPGTEVVGYNHCGAGDEVAGYQQSRWSDEDARGARERSTETRLNELAVNLQTNSISDHSSACFWCTCPFTSRPVHIPRGGDEDSPEGYGCFCSPECAVAHLFGEQIDSASRFERYALLNHTYGGSRAYKGNVKPAPDPHYTLDKFYGNLTIEEYREMLQTPRLLLVVDKPLTRVLPELLADAGGDRSVGPGGGGTGRYQLRRRRRRTKAEILSENFKMTPTVPPVPEMQDSQSTP